MEPKHLVWFVLALACVSAAFGQNSTYAYPSTLQVRTTPGGPAESLQWVWNSQQLASRQAQTSGSIILGSGWKPTTSTTGWQPSQITAYMDFTATTWRLRLESPGGPEYVGPWRDKTLFGSLVIATEQDPFADAVKGRVQWGIEAHSSWAGQNIDVRDSNGTQWFSGLVPAGGGLVGGTIEFIGSQPERLRIFVGGVEVFNDSVLYRTEIGQPIPTTQAVATLGDRLTTSVPFSTEGSPITGNATAFIPSPTPIPFSSNQTIPSTPTSGTGPTTGTVGTSSFQSATPSQSLGNATLTEEGARRAVREAIRDNGGNLTVSSGNLSTVGNRGQTDVENAQRSMADKLVAVGTSLQRIANGMKGVIEQFAALSLSAPGGSPPPIQFGQATIRATYVPPDWLRNLMKLIILLIAASACFNQVKSTFS